MQDKYEWPKKVIVEKIVGGLGWTEFFLFIIATSTSITAYIFIRNYLAMQDLIRHF